MATFLFCGFFRYDADIGWMGYSCLYTLMKRFCDSEILLGRVSVSSLKTINKSPNK